MHIREGGSGVKVQFQNPKHGRQNKAPLLISAKDKDNLCHKEMFVTMIAASFSVLKVKLLRYGLCLASARSPRAKPGDFPSLYCGS